MSDLDSFFAKKTKKKVKGKKFDNLDEMAKRLEEKERKEKKEMEVYKVEGKTLTEMLVSDKDVQEGPGPSKQEPEEEWKDFKEDEHDLTDLKLQKLQIDDEEDGSNYNEDGEGGPGQNEKSDGVWGKNLQNEKEKEIVQEPVVEQVEEKPTVNGRYMAPHLRNSSSTPTALPRSRMRQAPDITNEMAFPSLSDAKDLSASATKQPRKLRMPMEKAFENVKHGSTRSFARDNSNPKLSVANRFDALSDRC